MPIVVRPEALDRQFIGQAHRITGAIPSRIRDEDVCAQQRIQLVKELSERKKEPLRGSCQPLRGHCKTSLIKPVNQYRRQSGGSDTIFTGSSVISSGAKYPATLLSFCYGFFRAGAGNAEGEGVWLRFGGALT